MANGILTTSVQLPESLSTEIFSTVQEESAIMQLSTRVALPGNGAEIPVVTGDPEAHFVGEGENATVSNSSLDIKHMHPYKLVVIETFSNEFRDNASAIYEELSNRLPGAIAKKIDATIANGTAPGTNFDVLSAAETVNIGDKTYDAFVDAIDKVATAEGDLNGWILTPKARTILLKAKDKQDRPLFITNPATEGKNGGSSVLAIPSVFSRGVYAAKVASKTPEVVGLAGDWSGARFGIAKDITITMADQASLEISSKQVNLFQAGMFALKCEFSCGFVVRNQAQFVRLVNGTSA